MKIIYRWSFFIATIGLILFNLGISLIEEDGFNFPLFVGSFGLNFSGVFLIIKSVENSKVGHFLYSGRANQKTIADVIFFFFAIEKRNIRNQDEFVLEYIHTNFPDKIIKSACEIYTRRKRSYSNKNRRSWIRIQLMSNQHKHELITLLKNVLSLNEFLTDKELEALAQFKEDINLKPLENKLKSKKRKKEKNSVRFTGFESQLDAGVSEIPTVIIPNNTVKKKIYFTNEEEWLDCLNLDSWASNEEITAAYLKLSQDENLSIADLEGINEAFAKLKESKGFN